MDRGGNDRGPAGKLAWRERGGTWIIVASGPSFAPDQLDRLRDKAAAVVAVNTSFKALAGPGIVYACDGEWWDRYHEDVREAGHEGWTQDVGAAARYGLNYIQARAGKGLCTEPGTIFHGQTSGYQAIGLAWQMGAERIVLLGYDMQYTGGRRHWHGDHPEGLSNAVGIHTWLKPFKALAADLDSVGCEVVNCTARTALTCFRRADPAEIFGG